MLRLRQTLFGDYEQCPRICYKNWGEVGVEGASEAVREEHSNKYASLGTALHETMEWQGLELKQNRKPTRLELHDVFDVNFAKIPVELFEDEEDKDNFYNSGHEQIDWLYDNFKEMTPIVTEYTFTLDGLLEGMLPFAGTIDRVDGNIMTQDIHLGDYKSGKVFTRKELSSNVQATIYALAWEKLYGFRPKTFTFYFSKFGKIKEIKLTDEFIEAGVERIKSIWYHIVNKDFDPPARPNKFFCEHFCKHKSDCPRFTVPEGWEDIG
jgi:RecB family exonuclease